MNDINVRRPGQAEYRHVELDRTFHELGKYASESDDIDISRVFWTGEKLHWPDLLREYRVVILSEAGSGKTEEIHHIAQALRRDGKHAFFLRLEHVADDFEIAFEVGDLKSFKDWIAGSEEGWLLLDSVDEARLRNPKDFERAIKKLALIVNSAKERTHIFITGRSTAWRPKTDLALCTAQFPLTLQRVSESAPARGESEQGRRTTTTTADTSIPVFKVVTLDDLSAEQVMVFAAARGVNDGKAFIDAVERADASAFTARPQDLEELTGFWIEKKRIGGRLEVMSASIDRRLKERDQDRADARPLSAERARTGALLLAAATTLGQDATIRIPDGADNDKGISAKDVLADWNDADIGALLSRPIFDQAIYGTVRFHHRSVREYLTAEWIVQLLERAASRRQIEELFFRQQYELEVVVPVMRPVLPWLILLDPRIRERVCGSFPEIVLEGGDPTSLPLETRRDILHRVCSEIADGTSDRHDYASVQRFSSSDLTEDVRALIKTHASNDNMKSFLVRMIWLGELGGALPEAIEIALDKDCEHYARVAAFRAVASLGSEADRNRLRFAFLTEGKTIDRDWLSELLEDLEPTKDTLDWLLAAIQKAKLKERHIVDHLVERIATFVTGVPVSLLPAIVARFNALLDKPPHIERHFCAVSTRYEWLLPAAGLAVELLLQKKLPSGHDPAALAVMLKVAAAQVYRSDELSGVKQSLAKSVQAWPEANRALFWASIENVRSSAAQKGERVVQHWRVSAYGAFWAFDVQDFEYVLTCITSKDQQDDKLVALSLAFDLYRNLGRPAKGRAALKKAASISDEVTQRLSEYLNPPKQNEATKNFRRTESRWKKEDAERRRASEKNEADWREHLAKDLATVRKWHDDNPGEIGNASSYLFERLREGRSIANRWTKYNWFELKDEFGDDVARFYRDYMVGFWRAAKLPVIHSEGAPMNSTQTSVIFGLTGLEIEARETENWAKRLTPEEVERACRHASFELNGFPEWFPDLFAAHPELVGKFLMQEIRYELSVEKEDVDLNYILADVSWAGQWAWDYLAPAILALLQETEPKTLGNFDRLLKILQGSSCPGEPIAALAKKRSKHADLAHAGRWYAVWAGVEPDAAISDLNKRLNALKSLEKRTTLATNFVTKLWGGRSSEGSVVRPAFQTPRHLKSLYVLMHEHIRREDDIERAGTGVYSPDMRDNAQESRNSLYDQLNKMPGKDAYLALSEIAALQPQRPWLARHARTKAEQDADLAPWTPAEVREFHARLEKTPTTHRELATLALMRLLDLKDDVEHGDASIFNVLMKVDQETEMRTFIAKDLRDKAFGRYAIAQEEELADAKRIDLRFMGAGFDAVIPAELKLANKWSGPKLFERLENQLCGDYLRDYRSKRGLFVLVNQRSGKWELPNDGGSVDFDGLVAALETRWTELSKGLVNIDDVQVVGIDLTKRKKPASQ